MIDILKGLESASSCPRKDVKRRSVSSNPILLEAYIATYDIDVAYFDIPAIDDKH